MAAKARDYPIFRDRSAFDAWNGFFDPIISA
jgi:hypothetical protein